MILFSEDYYSKDCIKCVNDCKNTNYKQKCEDYINKKYNFAHSILTTSCTHSLEMMAMLLNIKEFLCHKGIFSGLILSSC